MEQERQENNPLIDSENKGGHTYITGSMFSKNYSPLDVWNSYGTTKITKRGKAYKGDCPQCNSNNFAISPQKKIFKCFGKCGIGGNATSLAHLLLKKDHETFINEFNDGQHQIKRFIE